MKNIPPPILLNCWKHHAGFVKLQILQTVKFGNPSINELVSKMLVIGDSLMDFYLGSLSPKEISEHVISYLTQNNVLKEKLYKNWIIRENSDYRLITLIDDSQWTLRWGREEDRYVHIHPARNSFHTIRIRALTLKTAILVLTRMKILGGSRIDINLINKLRVDYLNTPPIKSIKNSPGLIKLIKLLGEGIE